jgi:hypothetical protein
MSVTNLTAARLHATASHAELRTPSPLYAGERAGVRGLARATRVIVPRSSRKQPLTQTRSRAVAESARFSSAYRGEGTGDSDYQPRKRSIRSHSRRRLHPSAPMG